MTVKEILAKVKAVFDMGEPAPAPPVTTTSNPVSYGVDGGVPVFVDISDDGIPDIDTGDKVYTDATMASPYPDGTYTVTGTTFKFTVANGVVSTVDDTTGTGPGTPMDMAKDAPAPAPAPAPAAAPAPQPPAPITKPTGMAAEAKTPEQITALYESFANGTVDPANLGIVLKALMEYCFGWQIQEQQRKATADAAINVYKNDLVTAQATMAKQEKVIVRHEETIKGLFEIVEKLSEIPTEEPKTLTGAKKEKFERAQSRESKLEKVAEAIGKLRRKETATL